ncbi:MAG: hypothetical protein COB67_11755 [SAR324 cluster bacterium]|uniref:Uncharacterized protein n=1 Tax=SAR324 cluster bacterium TaxID=2024889 RepID=A0A2A4ST16_9DELT|nr:MAG: hypothetical protein COB67_11755 [SAR324 cluster bacterium]
MIYLDGGGAESSGRGAAHQEIPDAFCDRILIFFRKTYQVKLYEAIFQGYHSPEEFNLWI